MTNLVLRSGAASLQLAPDAGGSIAARSRPLADTAKAGEVTGDANLAVERIGEVVLVKLGMIRVEVPIARWAALIRESGAS